MESGERPMKSKLALIGLMTVMLSTPALALDGTPSSLAMEEIYIVRSVREGAPTDRPTEFCAKARTGVERATFERQFTFRSVGTSTLDGSVLDANAKTVGSAHACFGLTEKPAIFDFYADIVLESTRQARRIAFMGLGECQLKQPDFPEKGLTISRCFLDLTDLPSEYIGGLLTTNSMGSRKAFGTETDPPGYIQSSIATIRLWKKRDAR